MKNCSLLNFSLPGLWSEESFVHTQSADSKTKATRAFEGKFRSQVINFSFKCGSNETLALNAFLASLISCK